MSSDVQRYSTENQQNAIAEYAQQHGYQVVASYIDAGKSGLSLKGREALRQLLSDALAAQRAFDAILVLDVSRWGRFQNPDQAAHYEFLCRQAGVRVIYCGEPFGDDVAPITTIVKHLKRVMAGEYSRELSVKLSRAHRQQALLGFRQGGKLIYGFRRLLLDPTGNPRQVLNDGDKKALSSDKVTVIPGPPEELAVIRRIFRMYVSEKLGVPGIVKRLADEGVRGYGDRPLAVRTVRNILRTELCIGQMTYNLTTEKLQSRLQKNPEDSWTRFSAFEPVIPVALFKKAQKERRARWRAPRWSKQSIAVSLKRLLATKGSISQDLLNSANGAPSYFTVVRHFGSLQSAYAAAGYAPPPVIPFGMNGKFWSRKAVLTGLQNLYQAQGHVTNRLIDDFSELPSSAHIRRHFGSMREALRQAGLPVLSHSQIQQLRWKRRKAAGCDEFYRGVRWTDAELLGLLRQTHRQHGYITSSLLEQNKAQPSAYHFIRRFGSLGKAKVLAGLPVLTPSQIRVEAAQRGKAGTLIHRQRRGACFQYRPDDILLGLKRLAEQKGRISARLIEQDADLPTRVTIMRYFGSLPEAYRLAGVVRLDGKPERYGPAPA
jgi:DNA invertase Pin-like site-specific DNA recombinase